MAPIDMQLLLIMVNKINIDIITRLCYNNQVDLLDYIYIHLNNFDFNTFAI